MNTNEELVHYLKKVIAIRDRETLTECDNAFYLCCAMINRLDALPNGGSDAALKNKTLGRIANDRVMSVPESTQMLRRLYFRTKKLVLKLEAANG